MPCTFFSSSPAEEMVLQLSLQLRRSTLVIFQRGEEKLILHEQTYRAQVGAPTRYSGKKSYKRTQLSKVWWMPHQKLGFDTVMKTGLTRRFQQYPSTYMWNSSWLPALDCRLRLILILSALVTGLLHSRNKCCGWSWWLSFFPESAHQSSKHHKQCNVLVTNPASNPDCWQHKKLHIKYEGQKIKTSFLALFCSFHILHNLIITSLSLFSFSSFSLLSSSLPSPF